MNLKQQIISLRDSAARLAVDFPGAWHAESGIRGSIITPPSNSEEASGPEADAAIGQSKADCRRERLDFRRPTLEKDFKAFMKRFLCKRGKLQDVVEEPWRTFGYSFAAASAGSAVPTREQEETLDGIGHSFIYGYQTATGRLAHLVAFPAVKYLSRLSEHGWACGNSWGDPKTALGDWVYIVYEIGLTTGDPNLRRYYRFVSAIPSRAKGPIHRDLLVGFDGEEGIARPKSRCPRAWSLGWDAATRGELAFSRLGTELTLASRIALDHLLDMDAVAVSNEVFAKWQTRLVSRLNDTERYILEVVAQHASAECGMTTLEIAKKAGCDANSNFKNRLSGLVKLGLLENRGKGYFIPLESRWICCHLSQGHGQD